MSKQLDVDISASKVWLMQVATELARLANGHQDTATRLVDRLVLVAECASLPGDAPLRIRITPHVFCFKC